MSPQVTFQRCSTRQSLVRAPRAKCRVPADCGHSKHIAHLRSALSSQHANLECQGLTPESTGHKPKGFTLPPGQAHLPCSSRPTALGGSAERRAWTPCEDYSTQLYVQYLYGHVSTQIVGCRWICLANLATSWQGSLRHRRPDQSRQSVADLKAMAVHQ